MDCTVHGVSRSRTRLSDFYYFVIYQETPSFPVLLVRRDGSKVKNNLSLSLSLFFFFFEFWPWNSPGQNTRVGSFSLLQGIFPTQGSNPGLPHCRQNLYQLSH